MAHYLDLQIFADLVRHKRSNKGLREISSVTGVSASTLSRIENGKIPDIDTFLAVCDWLEIPPAEFIKNTKNKGKKDDYSTICAFLRTDGRLKPEVADALCVLIESAYLNQRKE